jgi:hypothetical protein
MVNEVHKYHSMCEMVDSVYVTIETQQRIFCEVSKYSISEPNRGLKYGEGKLEDIWRWVYLSQVYGHNSCKTHYIEKSEKPAIP